MSEWVVGNVPKDGTEVMMKVVNPFRFLPYKKNTYQFKRGDIGRWQAMDENGKWHNCSTPLGNEWIRLSDVHAPQSQGITVSVLEVKALLYGVPKQEFIAAISRLATWLEESEGDSFIAPQEQIDAGK